MASIFLNKQFAIRNVAILISMIFFISSFGAPANAADLHRLTVKSSEVEHTFYVEIMQTPEQRAYGLMNRQHMDSDKGMLFDFESSMNANMWMKNTYIPLDMLFIRSDGIIVNIAHDTVPQSTAVLSSAGPVRYVLEINARTSKRLGIMPGNKVVLPGAR